MVAWSQMVNALTSVAVRSFFQAFLTPCHSTR
ncbi:hypothetical protein J2754_000129 [Halarchaeum solikamskense]|nr:hypothetical protein [Halarchaeum solikamskense]